MKYPFSITTIIGLHQNWLEISVTISVLMKGHSGANIGIYMNFQTSSAMVTFSIIYQQYLIHYSCQLL